MAHKTQFNFDQWAICAGIVLLLAGLLLRTVDTFILTSETTAILSEWFGPPHNTPKGALQRIVVDNASPQKVLQPPRWFGWAMLTTGIVFLSYGVMGRWRS